MKNAGKKGSFASQIDNGILSHVPLQAFLDVFCCISWLAPSIGMHHHESFEFFFVVILLVKITKGLHRIGLSSLIRFHLTVARGGFGQWTMVGFLRTISSVISQAKDLINSSKLSFPQKSSQIQLLIDSTAREIKTNERRMQDAIQFLRWYHNGLTHLSAQSKESLEAHARGKKEIRLPNVLERAPPDWNRCCPCCFQYCSALNQHRSES
mmetsp:Transcript_3964/g.8486  ORF Transcript_3964/g.8486 Transcript_3964/m.8486 type:complete len:210 (-) Transcript_3964:413-1042(-)